MDRSRARLVNRWEERNRGAPHIPGRANPTGLHQIYPLHSFTGKFLLCSRAHDLPLLCQQFDCLKKTTETTAVSKYVDRFVKNILIISTKFYFYARNSERIVIGTRRSKNNKTAVAYSITHRNNIRRS